MNIIILILAVIGAVLGIFSSIGIVIMLFGTIGFKVYRKIKYGKSLFD
ncbi:MAG: hypothetical protein HFJ08_15145 [Lachnospiraceae bacterium]|nr:hypothetical protein [Lachnospiraceae bacterium]MCI9400558.1 hypothetical protein [Lachnospiraceae bacterium]MCX4378686.1 hypothetical protein [Lachnospiraceae bacterium]